MTYLTNDNDITYFAYNSTNILFNEEDVALQYDTSSGIEITGQNDDVVHIPLNSVTLVDSRCTSNWSGSDPRMFTNIQFASSLLTEKTRSSESSGCGGICIDCAIASGVGYCRNDTGADQATSVVQKNNKVLSGPDFEPYSGYSRIVGWRVQS